MRFRKICVLISSIIIVSVRWRYLGWIFVVNCVLICVFIIDLISNSLVSMILIVLVVVVWIIVVIVVMNKVWNSDVLIIIDVVMLSK